MPDVNFNLLTPAAESNPIKGSMAQAAPMPKAAPQQSGGLLGGLDTSATGMSNLKGLADSLKGLFGTNPVAQANDAIGQTLANVPAPSLAASMMSATTPSSMQAKAQGAISSPQAPMLPPSLSQAPAAPTIAPMTGSGGLLGQANKTEAKDSGFDIENHALTDVSDPKVQTTAIHSAVQAAAQPGATPYSVAASYVGQGRQDHADTLEGFFQKSLGQKVDIQKTPWCAAFANSVLASTGHGQTGSLAARSFLNYGQSTKTPSQGDVVVMQRGGSDSGLGHVGFFAGYSDDHTRVKVLAGNTNGQVMTKEYPLTSVLDYRVPPTAEELASKATGGQPGQGQTQMAANTPPEGGIRPTPSKYNDNLTQPQQLSPDKYEDLTRQFDKGQSYAYNKSTGRYS